MNGDLESYVDRAQLAERMSVSVDTIDRWRKAGMPSETWGMRKRVFLPSHAIAWARGRNDNTEGSEDAQ